MSFQSYQICVFAVGGGAKCVRSGVGKGKMRLGGQNGNCPHGSILSGDSYKLIRD